MSAFGSNAGFVDELYARYLNDPTSVSPAWQEFFADYQHSARTDGDEQPGGRNAPAAPPLGATTARAKQQAPTEKLQDARPNVAADEQTAIALRGIPASIAKNMVESLEVPTATSVRNIAVKLVDENRRVINQHQAVVAKPKVSFTHMIAWALVRAMEKHPGMNAGYEVRDGVPHRIDRPKINLGLAIDMERKGERILLVPNMKDAASLTFPDFLKAYNDLIARARANKLTLDDYQGTTVTLTNPGMIGTNMSVPRLMSGQSAIFGVGSIGYPPEYLGATAEVISELGLSKTMTVTSTYDHRVIQGAESGAFLATLEQLLLGADSFYERIFDELELPHEPLDWQADQNAHLFGSNGSNTEVIAKQASVVQLIRAHRVRGHLYAHLDPLEKFDPEIHPELELSTYGLTVWDLDRKFIAGGLAGNFGTLALRDILDTLRETYCRHIGAEFMHIPDPEIRRWLQERMESSRNAEPIDPDSQLRILSKLNDAEAFERFLHTAYVGQKRFSIEGAETVVPMMDALFNRAAELGVEEIIIGMAHRGRLNVLSNVIGKSYEAIFREFEGDIDPEMVHGSGDVKYHLGATGVHQTPAGKSVKLELASNPSHLEAVDPVVEGMARARQDQLLDVQRERLMPVLLHGDAAFSGQGVVAETLAMSQLAGYRTGGTVHLVINNQIGFTTSPTDAHSGTYCTDVAKMVGAPIFHVNGDYPEDAVRMMRLAMDFRQTFKRDVVVDLVCYRRWGHNEGDDPSYTSPLLYAKIAKHRSVRKLYTEQLLRRGDIDMEQAEAALQAFQNSLREVHEGVRAAMSKKPAAYQPRGNLEAIEGRAQALDIDTTTDDKTIATILDGLDNFPKDFKPHPKLMRQLSKRKDRVEKNKIDWALAESLAFGSLVLEGTTVRLSGEDSGRGTFSQRHAKFFDYETGELFVPLARLSPDQAPFWVYDSLLSEFAVLGFDYGYSVAKPKALVMWEAQFGDFVNGAQVIIDQFIASAEEKWNLKSSLVMLLPHGYEGQGPEHSSARMERFLQLAARGNIQVAYPSTPAQYFHLLRRQVRLPSPKPLVVFTPKSLLRLPAAVSAEAELTTGKFQEILDDPQASNLNTKKLRRVLLCTGKVFYDLDAYRQEQGIDDVAICRVEQLYPYPGEQLEALLAQYKQAKSVLWVQEEPKNMGAWDFLCLEDHLPACLHAGQSLRFVGRPPSPSPATGSSKRHQAEQNALVADAFAAEGATAKKGKAKSSAASARVG